MTDIRTQFLGSCAKIAPDESFAGVNLSKFVQHLLLFERYILHSFRLRETSLLIEAFGYGPVMALLKSNAIKILCDAVFIVYATDEVRLTNETGGLVRVGQYSFGFGRIDRQRLIHGEMQAFHKIEGLNQKKVIKLKGAVASKLAAYEENAGEAALEQFTIDLSNNSPVVAVAIAKAVERETHRQIDPASFSLQLVPVDSSTFEIITNLNTVCDLDEHQTIKIIGKSLLAVSELHQQIGKMKSFQAMTGLRDGELPLWEEKLTSLVHQFNPDLQLERFQNVLQVAGFPNLDESLSEKVDLEKLLEIRESRECKEFRTWLWSADSATDEEIKDQFTGLAQRLSVWAHGNVGKSLRWTASTGIGLIPVVGNVAGAVTGLIDSFLLEKVLPQSGPVIFLSRQYPSLFKE